MIAKLARRLGFQPSVPVSTVDDWILPRSDDTVALAPRGGAATMLVDGVGRVQPVGRTWTLDWTLAAGARWVSAIEAERVRQRLVGPATLETTVVTPAGEVVQRVAAAVVDGQPVGLIEVENRGGVAIAVGVVARPLVHGGRGFLGSAEADAHRLDLGSQGIVHVDGVAAGASATADGFDLLAHMPAADAGHRASAIRSRAGGAQAAAVVAVPHTATVRFVVELADSVRPNAAVPSIDDVDRGWMRHLESGAGFDVGDTGLAERLAVASRALLTGWPPLDEVPAAMTALAELGFGNDATRLLPDIDRLDDDHVVLAAVARFAQLGEQRDRLDALDEFIGPIARAVHTVASASSVRGPAWLPWAYGALGASLDAIDQPDVASRVRGIRVDAEPTASSLGGQGGGIDDLLMPSADLALLAEPATAARLVLGVRQQLVADRGDGVDLLPALPVGWRGQPINALRVPVEGGAVSFGLRWHGPRPALLWEVDGRSGPFTVTAAGLDPSFSSTEATGETLLADPGWPRA